MILSVYVGCVLKWPLQNLLFLYTPNRKKNSLLQSKSTNLLVTWYVNEISVSYFLFTVCILHIRIYVFSYACFYLPYWFILLWLRSQISPNDDLSQEVCLHCAENVSKCYAFVSRVIETQNKLRRMVPLPESKSKVS